MAPQGDETTQTRWEAIEQLERLKSVHEVEKTLAVQEKRIDFLEDVIRTLISRTEFQPVKLLTYAMAGTILAGVLGAVLTSVLHK